MNQQTDFSSSNPEMDLDPGLTPATMWKADFYTRLASAPKTVSVRLALLRPDGTGSRYNLTLLPDSPDIRKLNRFHLERTLKFLLWQRGGSRVYISGCDALTGQLAQIYSPKGDRAFDADFFGEKIYGEPLTIQACREEDLPDPQDRALALGGHLDGCRIGFDLGGSDRKCAAVVDGEVVFSEEIRWDPYFESDPTYHLEGIRDSLRRAAEHLPRVDAIGGSAAGVYVNNQVKVASLFRGVSDADFKTHVRDMFLNLKQEWGVPFEVVNDGEVTALAGAMSLDKGGLLGISMGTSLAAGYCDPEGRITSWLNELAFAPVDYRDHAPEDEWSGDLGCGVQYFSQQGVSRLAGLAGYEFSDDLPFAERLIAVQEDMQKGAEPAQRIYTSIGTAFGHTLAHYADFYDLRHVMILGRVTSGAGGDRILERAQEVLKRNYPELSERLSLSTPDEKMKRHGQAVAAASLPATGENS
jgi:predicted NBD/HSP70 family sugar kinase